MKHVVNVNIDAILQAIGKIYHSIFSFTFIVIMLSISFSLPLCLYLLTKSIEPVIGKINLDPQITIYLKTNANNEDIAKIKDILVKNPNVKNIEFKTKDKGLDELSKQLGEENIIDNLDINPLPDVFIITPNTKELNTIEKLVKDFSNINMVEEAKIDASWVKTLFYLNSFLLKILWFLSITLSLAFILVSYNTIRLQILSQKEEIEVSKLLGAPNSFIRRPFLYQSFIQGFFTLVIAVVFSSFILYKASSLANKIVNSYGIIINAHYFNIVELFIMLLIVTILSLTGSIWAVYKHLSDFKVKYD